MFFFIKYEKKKKRFAISTKITRERIARQNDSGIENESEVVVENELRGVQKRKTE